MISEFLFSLPFPLNFMVESLTCLRWYSRCNGVNSIDMDVETATHILEKKIVSLHIKVN